MSRTPEETLAMFKKVLGQRKAYVRKKLKEAKGEQTKSVGRPSIGSGMSEAIRAGMMSELSTVEAILALIEMGNERVEHFWAEEKKSCEV